MHSRRSIVWSCPAVLLVVAFVTGPALADVKVDDKLTLDTTPEQVVAQITGQAEADEAPAEEPEVGSAFSWELGFDITNAYYFRGIIQENQGFIIQPYADGSWTIFEEGDGFINSMAFGLGIWNSFHDGPSGSGGATVDPESWYESDLYFYLSFGLPLDISLDIIYTFYTSPNDSFSTVHELALGIGFNDQPWWEALGIPDFTLNPGMTFAFETQNTAFGPDEGIYFEFGIEPEFMPFEEGPLKDLTVSIPVTIGLSISDYYETARTFDDDLGDFVGENDDDAFGYVQVGVAASLPLPIPAQFGQASLSAGVNVLFLGDSLEDANNDDDVEVIGVIGVSISN